MANLKYLIEKDWIESAEIEKETKKYYESIIEEGNGLGENSNLDDENGSEVFNELNLNSNLLGINRKSSI